jgi:hypothetical protein
MKTELEIKIKKSFTGEERNLFIVNYPLQLLNAIEAQRYFKTKNNILVIFYYEDKKNSFTQLMKLTELFDYNQLIIFQKKKMSFMISLIKELQKENYTKIFTGFFSANLRRIIANLHYKELFLIDDGVYSISVHNELCNPDAKGYKTYITPYSEHDHANILKSVIFYLYHHFRKSYLLLLGYKNDMEHINLSFYTIFDLPQYKDEVIINNNYDFLKSYYQRQNNTSQRNHNDFSNSDRIVYFLGQPLYQSSHINYAQYLSFLKAVFQFYISRKQKIVYIPHRNEKKDTPNDIEQMYPYGVKVHELSIPFELYLLENSIDINHLASFGSSALFTVKKLYPHVIVDTFTYPAEGPIGKNILLIYKMLAKNQTNIWDISINRGTEDISIHQKETLSIL